MEPNHLPPFSMYEEGKHYTAHLAVTGPNSGWVMVLDGKGEWQRFRRVTMADRWIQLEAFPR